MTDDTAKAILAFDKDELFYYEPPSVAQEQNGVSGFSPLLGVDVTDLKQMARLWLLRDEIVGTSSGKPKGTDAVVTTVTGSTITFRNIRWYERLWAKVKHIWNWRDRRAFNKLYDEAAKQQKQRNIERDILNADVIGE